MSRFYPMVQIPGGEEDLRDDRKKLQWKATIPPFLLGAYPVTNELYEAVVGDSDTVTNSSHSHHMPVVNISWRDAVVFCNLLSQRSGLTPCYSIGSDGETVQWNVEADGFRLPTEAEWQYACKAGNSSYQYGKLDQIAWYNDIHKACSMRLGARNRMHGDCTICSAMYGNGAGIFMMSRCTALIEYFAGEAGLKRQEDAEQHAVGAAILHSVSRILDSA